MFFQTIYGQGVYLSAMGVTSMRIRGLVYAIIWFTAMAAFSPWVVKPPTAGKEIVVSGKTREQR
jgi:hypothetical protein